MESFTRRIRLIKASIIGCGKIAGGYGATIGGAGCATGTVAWKLGKNVYHECFTPKGIAKKVIKDTIHKVF